MKTKDIIPEGMGERIAEMRRSHNNMTQEALGNELDISSKHISHVERGVASLSISNMLKICRIFGCSIDYLLTGQENDKAYSQLPSTIVEILHSDDQKEKDRLRRYLDIYAEIYNDHRPFLKITQ